jgi:shikimate dehydrogenase
MVEAAFHQHGLNWRYINMEVQPQDLATAVSGAKAMGFQGFNLSIPHKVSVIPLLDGLGQSAAIMGAVNCVVRRGDQWIGENTDGKGFLTSLTEKLDVRGQHLVILGAGGAARAIAVELALAGVGQLTIVNRSPQRGEDLLHSLRQNTGCPVTLHPWSAPYPIPTTAAALINATSIGLYDEHTCPEIDLTTLRPDLLVADVVFNPVHTALLRTAQKIGCTTVDGLGMLVNQGVIGIQYWTGITPDPQIMRQALIQALS